MQAGGEGSGGGARGGSDDIEAVATAEIDAATEYAGAAPTPDPATAMRHVFVEEE